MNKLPTEVLLKIFRHSDGPSGKALGHTSSNLHQVWLRFYEDLAEKSVLERSPWAELGDTHDVNAKTSWYDLEKELQQLSEMCVQQRKPEKLAAVIDTFGIHNSQEITNSLPDDFSGKKHIRLCYEDKRWVRQQTISLNLATLKTRACPKDEAKQLYNESDSKIKAEIGDFIESFVKQYQDPSHMATIDMGSQVLVYKQDWWGRPIKAALLPRKKDGSIDTHNPLVFFLRDKIDDAAIINNATLIKTQDHILCIDLRKRKTYIAEARVHGEKFSLHTYNGKLAILSDLEWGYLFWDLTIAKSTAISNIWCDARGIPVGTNAALAKDPKSECTFFEGGSLQLNTSVHHGVDKVIGFSDGHMIYLDKYMRAHHPETNHWSEFYHDKKENLVQFTFMDVYHGKIRCFYLTKSRYHDLEQQGQAQFDQGLYPSEWVFQGQ